MPLEIESITYDAPLRNSSARAFRRICAMFLFRGRKYMFANEIGLKTSAVSHFVDHQRTLLHFNISAAMFIQVYDII